MRTFVTVIVIIAVVLGAVAAYLAVTTPRSAVPVRFPLSPAHRRLLARVPATADAFALIPSAAQLQRVLLANRVTQQAALSWTDEHELPRAWMLGGADVVAWKSGSRTSYAVRLDPFRAVVVRLWLMMASNADSSWDGSTLLMHGGAASQPASDLDELLRLAAPLPPGNVFVVQRRGSRGAFPPIARPAVTSIRVDDDEIDLVSRAADEDPGASRPITARFPRGALLAASFASAPKMVSDLNRLFGAEVDALLDDGGSIALYDIETGTLLPRPRGVIAVPADDRAREQMKNVEQIADVVGEVRDTGSEILVSFDRTSMGLYTKDAFVPATWPATRWALRLDPRRLVPILVRLGGNPALRFATPRIHRGVRDLRRWIEALEQAGSIEASDSAAAGVEELRVRVVAK